MVITRATDYAVRILAVLSSANGKRLTLADLAAATSVPRDYVAKELTPLVRRSWVQSYRGADGGFSLAGKNQNITLLDVVELYEGPLHLQTCTGSRSCEFAPACPAHSVWLEAEKELCGCWRSTRLLSWQRAAAARGFSLPQHDRHSPKPGATE